MLQNALDLDQNSDLTVQETSLENSSRPNIASLDKDYLIISNRQTHQYTMVEAIEINLDTPTVHSSTYQRKRMLYRGITVAAVLLNPLFAIFLYIAISKAIDECRNQFNLQHKFWEVFFIILNLTISSLSGISDLIVVNPIEETEELLKPLGENQLTERLKHLSLCKGRSIIGFNYFNQTIGNTVFFVGAASAALSLTYISSSNELHWGLGVPVTILGHIYLNMLSRAKIDEHSYQFIYRLSNRNEYILINAIKSPAKSLEVSIQVFVNALNRGITYGYIMEQILKEYFNENSTSNNVVIPLISYAAASSFYTFLFSRTLNVHKQFFNPQFDELTTELLKNTKISYLGTVVDIGMTLLRAGAASTLLFRHGPNILPLNIFLTASLGLFLTSHGLYVRHKNRLYQTALDARLKQLVMSTRIDSQQAIRELSSEEMFDLIKEQFKIRTCIKISATIINGGSRLADWFSFLGFLITMNKLIGSNNIIILDFYDLLCIQQLLCNPALENAFSFFQEGMIDTLAYYRTKFYLERNDRRFGCRCLVKPKIDYPKNYLQKFLPTQERDIELLEILPDRHSIAEMQTPLQEEENLRPLTTLFELQKAKDNVTTRLEAVRDNSNDVLEEESIRKNSSPNKLATI